MLLTEVLIFQRKYFDLILCFHICKLYFGAFQGTFRLTMEFTEEYPNKPPIVKFISKMFHPNGMIFQ